MKELTVEQHLIKSIEALGWWCLKFPPLFFAGFPDRIILGAGATIVFVETKAPSKAPSKLQARIHKQLKRFGFRVEVIDTIEKVDALILTI